MESVEPMTLGSPSNAGHSPGYASSQFLPSYLMGESTTSGMANPVNNRPSFGGSQSPYALCTTPRRAMVKDCGREVSGFAGYQTGISAKMGAPPVHSLNEDLQEIKFHQGSARSIELTPKAVKHDDLLRFKAINSLNQSTPVNTSLIDPKEQNCHLMKTPPSPGQLDPFYTQGEELHAEAQLDDTWVTIFGFPNLSASFVLKRFSQYGTILTRRTAAANGNYMHIRYESTLQARRALSQNGKILPGNIMIGVMPCIELGVMSTVSSDAENTALSNAQGSSLKQSLRSLTSAYNAATNDNKVTSEASTPKKTNGLLNKTLDYMFG